MMSSLTTCSGQGVVVQGKEKEKEPVVKDIRNKSSQMGVIDPEATDKAMDASSRSMRHSSAIGMRLWKMWREAEI